MSRRTAARPPAFSDVPLNVGDALDESHELGAGLGIGLEDAQHAAGENPTALLFDAAHLHAEVISLHHNGDADRLEVFLQALGDLAGHSPPPPPGGGVEGAPTPGLRLSRPRGALAVGARVPRAR